MEYTRRFYSNGFVLKFKDKRIEAEFKKGSWDIHFRRLLPEEEWVEKKIHVSSQFQKGRILYTNLLISGEASSALALSIIDWTVWKADELIGEKSITWTKDFEVPEGYEEAGHFTGVFKIEDEL